MAPAMISRLARLTFSRRARSLTLMTLPQMSPMMTVKNMPSAMAMAMMARARNTSESSRPTSRCTLPKSVTTRTLASRVLGSSSAATGMVCHSGKPLGSMVRGHWRMFPAR